MKKYLLVLITVLGFNCIYSQVLYTDNFDNHSVGNLGSDVTGKIPGQWGWVTISKYTQANGFFTIVNETNRGKVLDITALSHNEGLYAFKPGIDKLIDTRTTGNDVIKFEIDYFTGSKQSSNSNSASWIKLLPIGEVEGGLIAPDYLSAIIVSKSSGQISCGALGTNGFGFVVPFNTWVKINTYLDYPNRKIYFEIPSLNKVFVGDFLKNDPSTNLIQDYKPSIISLTAQFIISTQDPQTVTRNRYDNIKITAINAVPPNIIALSTSEQFATKFNLYPNPATNVVNITNAENMLVNQVAIYDVAGKQLSTQTYNNETEIQLNVEHLASGTYLLHLQTNEGTAVKKLVKK